MKKIYALFFAAFASATAFAQMPVTFSVDMASQTVNPLGVHIAGNFQDPNYDGTPENPDYLNWTPSAIEMTDEDGDMLYTVTLNLIPGTYEYKFINGDNWNDGNGTEWGESVPNTCSVSMSNGNRFIVVGEEPAESEPVCFGNCTICGESLIRFSVDMSTVDTDNDGVAGEAGEDIFPDGVSVAGNFQNPYNDDANNGDWTPGVLFLTDGDGDMVYEGVFSVGPMSSITYKFINGNSWDFPNENITGDCGSSGNRVSAITGSGSLPVVCWNSCGACVAPSMITFSVNMALTCNDYVTAGVNLMGDPISPGGWGAGSPMSDDDGDGIYTITLPVAPGTYPYKFRVGGGGWEGIPGDRSITVVAGEDQVVPVVCFGSFDDCGTAYPSADVTFEVRLSTDIVLGVDDKVWVFGDFTGFQGGAIEMLDGDGDGVYSTTVVDYCPQTAAFKFAYGPNNTSLTEENADFSSIGGCGIDNGGFTDNRFFQRQDDQDLSFCFTYNTCDGCTIIENVSENELVSDLSVYPVPATDLMNISFNAATAGKVVVSLLNNLGQTVKVMDLGTVSGTRNIQMNVSDLAAGVYALQFSNGSERTVRTIAVK